MLFRSPCKWRRKPPAFYNGSALVPKNRNNRIRIFRCCQLAKKEIASGSPKSGEPRYLFPVQPVQQCQSLAGHVRVEKATPHNGSCRLRRIFCPIMRCCLNRRYFKKTNSLPIIASRKVTILLLTAGIPRNFAILLLIYSTTRPEANKANAKANTTGTPTERG